MSTGVAAILAGAILYATDEDEALLAPGLWVRETYRDTATPGLITGGLGIVLAGAGLVLLARGRGHADTAPVVPARHGGGVVGLAGRF